MSERIDTRATESRIRSSLETAALEVPGSDQVSVWRSNDGWSVNWFDGARRMAKVEVCGHTGSNTGAMFAALHALAGKPTLETQLRELVAKWRERGARVEEKYSARKVPAPDALWGIEIAADELEALLKGGA